MILHTSKKIHLLKSILQFALRISLVYSVFYTSSTFAVNDPVKKGTEIALLFDQARSGWLDHTANIKMTLKTSGNLVSYRALRIKSLEVDGDGDKQLVVFDLPKDLRGTSLLTYSHINKNDDQWLYLPAIKRVKRISSAGKTGLFMGSEFTFEDMAAQGFYSYNYEYINTESCDNKTCYVLKRIPTNTNSGYSYQYAWVDTVNYTIHKIEYYSKENMHHKSLFVSGYHLYKDKFWRARHMSMINHETGKATELEWSNRKFKSGLDQSDFRKNNLKRAK